MSPLKKIKSLQIIDSRYAQISSFLSNSVGSRKYLFEKKTFFFRNLSDLCRDDILLKQPRVSWTHVRRKSAFVRYFRACQGPTKNYRGVKFFCQELGMDPGGHARIFFRGWGCPYPSGGGLSWAQNPGFGHLARPRPSENRRRGRELFSARFGTRITNFTLKTLILQNGFG